MVHRFYCLPDNYEVIDSALDDIKEALNPTYTSNQVQLMDNVSNLARDVGGVEYLPGYIGLNNLGSTDFVNVIVHSLAHVAPLRDFFMVLRTRRMLLF